MENMLSVVEYFIRKNCPISTNKVYILVLESVYMETKQKFKRIFFHFKIGILIIKYL